ncbi:hypothetical protein Z517_10947 [Fonsecaea pedrosoi CBS 271.37]|uniref:Uncharacterized protein n=1 Tax=Fonsecaea pedrosoi CBS 271.37 TaxID=1442368 RepID=A0A0D2DES9_9EURO|nr:uncharacterized protein Z517_10947 [Fonsecaea pedrosoi CBS 271.37]KIW76201.1 hypothetical protein Z517_10947 [Fonsecaea pedrosoi CBS 271.37]
MDQSPRGRKRPYLNYVEEFVFTTATEFPEYPEYLEYPEHQEYLEFPEDLEDPDRSVLATKSSPSPQEYEHESPFNMKIHMPMPLHHPKAGLLRTQSPLTRQHLSLPCPTLFHRATTATPTLTPLVRTLDAPLPHSYGSLVTLDPASLSPIPDPVAIAEIKRLAGPVRQQNGYGDVPEMTEVLTRDDASEDPTSSDIQGPTLASNEILDGVFGDYTAEMAGADFDIILSQLVVHNFDDPPVKDEQGGGSLGKQ